MKLCPTSTNASLSVIGQPTLRSHSLSKLADARGLVCGDFDSAEMGIIYFPFKQPTWRARAVYKWHEWPRLNITKGLHHSMEQDRAHLSDTCEDAGDAGEAMGRAIRHGAGAESGRR